MNKKLKHIIMVIVLCCVWVLSPLTSVPLFENTTARAASVVWSTYAADSFAGGTGTSADPFLISTAEQLAYFSQQVNSGVTFQGQYIKLTQDILLNRMDGSGNFLDVNGNIIQMDANGNWVDANGNIVTAPNVFTCIGNNGNATGNNGGFMGTFDGDSRRVIGLYINKPMDSIAGDNQGLFGFANDNSTIRCLGVVGSVTGHENVGGVVGRTRGTVEMCFSNCTVAGVTHVGGVAGNADQHSIVKNCYNTGSVTGVSYVGGVSGIIDKYNVLVEYNYNAATVDGEQYVGGVAGSNEHEGTILHNYYDSNNYTGGGIGGSTTGTDVDEPTVGWDDGAVGCSSDELQGNVVTEEGVSVIDLLNEGNPDGEVWNIDTPGINDGYPILGVFIPLSVYNCKIAAGKHYTADTMGANTSLAVTGNSVFTVRYSVSYTVYCSMQTQTLGLTNNDAAVQLPAGTSITMLAEGSYYYLNLATAAPKVSLGEFIKMGGTEHFAPPAQAQPDDVKDFLFIFDFTKTAAPIPAGTYSVELQTAEDDTAGTMPTVTAAGVNTYLLNAVGSAGSLAVNLSSTPVAGYDYKTDGKIYAYELDLEQGGAAVPWPVGTKINGTPISSALPYVFTAAAFGDTPISIDMSECVNPLTGSCIAWINTYACTDMAAPREGFLLVGGSATITLESPSEYAIWISAPTRVFSKSESAIEVAFTVKTLGSGTVKSTLQRKYGMVYVNIADQADLPVSISGESATLTIPAGYDKGTYRFALTLYDSNNTARAQAVESVIIK